MAPRVPPRACARARSRPDDPPAPHPALRRGVPGHRRGAAHDRLRARAPRPRRPGQRARRAASPGLDPAAAFPGRPPRPPDPRFARVGEAVRAQLRGRRAAPAGDRVRRRARGHDDRLGGGGLAAGRACAAPAAPDHRHGPARVGREPRRAHRPRGPGRRAQGAGRHLRRHARAPRLPRSPASATSWPTPRTSCARRWPSCAPSSTSRWPTRRRAPTSCGPWGTPCARPSTAASGSSPACSSWPAARPWPGERRPIDLASLAADCLTDMRARARAAEVEMRSALAPRVDTRRAGADRAHDRQPDRERDPPQPARRLSRGHAPGARRHGVARRGQHGRSDQRRGRRAR